MTNLDLIIPASGKARRLEPLSNYLPKPILPILDKNILERIIEITNKINFNKIYITTPSEKTIETYKNYLDSINDKINYLNLINPNGLGEVITSFKNIIENDFVFLYGDCIYDLDSIEQLISIYEPLKIGFLLNKVENDFAHNYSCVEWKEEKINKIISKPEKNNVPSNDAVLGYILPKEICSLTNEKKNRQNEYPLSNLVNILLDRGYKSYFIYSKKIYHITNMKDYFAINFEFLKKNNLNNYIGKNVYIEKNVNIINSIIYDNSKIYSDIINSIILPDSNVLKKQENNIYFTNN